MEKRGRGRPRKVSPFNQDPEFFEVFLPDLLSHQLRIPSDFIKQFDVIQETIILKDLSGKVWHVDLKQEETGVFMKKGWNQFVNDKSLELGEFMIFRYNRKTATFTVRIFGLDGCKKEEAESLKEPSIHVKDEQESDQTSVPIHKRKDPDTNHHKPERLTDSRKADPQRTPKDDSKRVRRQEGYEGQSIRFVTCITKSKQSQLHIPKSIIDAYNVEIKPNEEGLLYNENGDSWPVKILRRPDSRTLLTQGWFRFRKDNGVEIYDKVKITLLLDKSREYKEFHVKVVGKLWRKAGVSKN